MQVGPVNMATMAPYFALVAKKCVFMRISEHQHLTYCTNIHPGEGWQATFDNLKRYLPEIREHLETPPETMGIGLRLSDRASTELAKPGNMEAFQEWLVATGAYVFTLNGFPFGGFHGKTVKDKVHEPDWSTQARYVYTERMFQQLAVLLPEGMDGGISTSPLTYRHWYTAHEQEQLKGKTAEVLADLVFALHKAFEATGKLLHLDMEPEPDGLLESGAEFMAYYKDFMLMNGRKHLQRQHGFSSAAAEAMIRRHFQLCYDVCHFAVGYEPHEAVMEAMQAEAIGIGKIQVSAALKASFPKSQTGREALLAAFADFDEPTYLHQVVQRNTNGSLLRFRDLPQALASKPNADVAEWRTHFHVPIFVEDYGRLQATQTDILEVMALQKRFPVSHLEVETYTWGVLPKDLQLPLAQSIARELNWLCAHSE